ncbi:MAG: thioredoxin domain-containing protein [Gemmatimonadaceae bacterium]|nr:thioredoxin domain-containing protein [Gemmatimonadaceae bacterium]
MSGGQLTPPLADGDHILGSDDAPLTLVEYGDYECPYCGMAYPIVKEVQQHLGDRLRFAFRNFPLTESHPHAEHAAEAAEEAAVQGRFWEMHDTLFEHQRALDDTQLVRYAAELGLDASEMERALDEGRRAPRVRRDFRSGVRSGVNGTPTFFINGRRYDGDWTDPSAFLRALRATAEHA